MIFSKGERTDEKYQYHYAASEYEVVYRTHDTTRCLARYSCLSAYLLRYYDMS